MENRFAYFRFFSRPLLRKLFWWGLGFTIVVGLILFRFSVAQKELRAISQDERKANAGSPGASLQTFRNLGKAYYEQGRYEEAIAEFAKVTTSGQSIAEDHLNLGLALLQNRQLDAALGELTTAKQMAPKMTAVLYNLGILYKRQLRYPEAEAALQDVVKVDPNDPAAAFNLAKVRFDQRKLPEALEAYRRVEAMGFGQGQNFYVATLFHTFTSLMRLKRREEAKKYFEKHQAIKDQVPSISLQLPALEGGKYGSIRVRPPAPNDGASRKTPRKLNFSEVTSELGIRLEESFSRAEMIGTAELEFDSDSPASAAKRIAASWEPSWVLTDYDQDSHADLLVVNPAGRSRLFHNSGSGKFTEVTQEVGLSQVQSILGAAFADYDNSSRLSLLLAGAEGARLYQQNEEGRFADVTQKAGLAGPEGVILSSAKFFDSDNDGLLDLLLTGYVGLPAAPASGRLHFPEDFPAAGNYFYRNNGDGTFTEQTRMAGLDKDSARSRNAIFSDFNNDAYIDLLIFREGRSPRFYLGQGEAKFKDRTREAGEALAQARARAGEVADFNHDGNLDLLLWTDADPQLLLNNGQARFSPGKGFDRLLPNPHRKPVRGTVADLNADGGDDLLLVHPKEIQILLNDLGTGFRPAEDNFPDTFKGSSPTSLVVGPVRGWGQVNLLTLDRKGRLHAFERKGPPARWLQIGLEGYKSNKQGVGSSVEVKSGNFYRKVLVTGGPLQIFTGDREKIDVVRVTWPNLIVQNRVEVTPDQSLELRESERLASSCPFLYVWDGERYVFLTDVLGISPLGELSPEGTYFTPNPEEYVRIPGERMKEQLGRYVLQFTNELREADFFDQARLYALDHSAEQDVYADERYSSPPFAPPTTYSVCRKRVPVSAVDDHGHDVLPLLRHADAAYAGDFRRDRIMGVAEPHTLTLDLGTTEDLPADIPVRLFLNGWVLWMDSNGARAASTDSKVSMLPPSLQVKDEQGRWVTVIDEVGLPSGTNRTMVVDLTGKFLSQDRSLRMVTNLCVYWDQIFFATDQTCGTVRRTELPLVSADLHYRGFSQPIHDPQYRRPDDFDYQALMASAPWNPHVGLYTRYGEVKELLAEADDQSAVMSVGDELTVVFDAGSLPPLPAGWKRDFMLHVQGWAKSGDPNTAFGKSVEPMPFRAMSGYPYREPEGPPSDPAYQNYLRRYQSRRAQALMAPLAPYRSQR